MDKISPIITIFEPLMITTVIIFCIMGFYMFCKYNWSLIYRVTTDFFERFILSVIFVYCLLLVWGIPPILVVSIFIICILALMLIFI